MALKKFRATTPARRFYTVSDFSGLDKDKPLKSLVKKHTRTGGRNSSGRLTRKCQAGGHKKRYREIDFRRNREGIPAKVASIQYDPMRSAHIALLHYVDGYKNYILCPAGLKKGDTVVSAQDAEISVGNCLPLKSIPIGTAVHNIQIRKNADGQMVRSAGSSAQIISREGKYAHVKLPSGEVRLFHTECKATIGQVSNLEHENVTLGKAGRSRWLGKRPRVRAVAMNPVDHPMGGGEGKSSGGRHPCSPKGTPAKGFKTRKKGKSTKHIVKRRK